MFFDESRCVGVDWRSEVLDALEGRLCVPDFTVRGVGVRKHLPEGGLGVGEDRAPSGGSTAVAVDCEAGLIEVRRAKRKLGDRRRFVRARQCLCCGRVDPVSRIHGLRRPLNCRSSWPVPTRRPWIC
jgi:hypothetical protein